MLIFFGLPEQIITIPPTCLQVTWNHLQFGVTIRTPSLKTRGRRIRFEDYVVYEVPRSMFRQAASMFSDVRHADQDSRYDEITLQLFLQMVFESTNFEA